MPTIINKTHLEKIQKCQSLKALPTTIDDLSSPWRNLGKINKELSFEPYTNCKNFYQIWKHALKNNQNKEIIGVREVVEVIDDDLISNENFVIFADTRKEWMVTALACSKFGLPIVTVYSTLGCENVDYLLGETNGKYLFTSEDQLNKLEVICDKTNFLSKIIYFKDSFSNKSIDINKLKSIECVTYDDIISSDTLNNNPSGNILTEVYKNNPAIIMYTSGTPKGTILTHQNLIAGLSGINSHSQLDGFIGKSRKVSATYPSAFSSHFSIDC